MLDRGPASIAEKVGDVAATLDDPDVQVIERTYTLPYLPHACMEVLNCTVRLGADGCEIWAPTQGRRSRSPPPPRSPGCRRPGSDHDVHGRRARAEVRAGLHHAGHPHRDGHRSSGETHLAARGGHDARPVPSDGRRSACAPHSTRRAMSPPGRTATSRLRSMRSAVPRSRSTQAIEGRRARRCPTNSAHVSWITSCIRRRSPSATGARSGTRSTRSRSKARSTSSRWQPASTPHEFRRRLLAHDPRGLAVLDRAAGMARWGGTVPPDAHAASRSRGPSTARSRRSSRSPRRSRAIS